MSLAPIGELPGASRAWVYGTRSAPSDGQAASLREGTRGFLSDWAAHRRALRAGMDWRYGRFLVVAVDESRAAASGCSIDALVDHLRGWEEETGVGLLDASPVWFRDPARDGRVRAVSRPDFRRLAAERAVDADTTVFDLAVERLEEVRSGRWERPAGESWHADLLPGPRSSPPAARG